MEEMKRLDKKKIIKKIRERVNLEVAQSGSKSKLSYI